MKPPPRLRLEPRPSRIACVAIIVGFAGMTGLMLWLQLDAREAGAAVVFICGVGARSLWRCSGRGIPVLLYVGHGRTLTATLRDGRSIDGAILDDSYVGARITTIVWRPERASRYRPAQTIVILPDTLPAEDFRRLRVLLRYGRPIVDEAGEGTSGRAAP